MTIRNIKYQLEAKLKGKEGGFFSKPSGKLERKSYENSVERLKISFRNLKSPNNELAVVTANGTEIAQIPIQNGAGRLDNESSNSSDFPVLEVGQVIDVHIGGTIVLSGKLYED